MQQSLVSLSSLSDDLQQQLVHLNEALGAIGSYRKVDAAKLIQCFDSWFNQKWFGVHSNPRSAPSTHVTYSAYEQWFASVPFADQDLSQPSSWISQVVESSAGINPAHMVV